MSYLLDLKDPPFPSNVVFTNYIDPRGIAQPKTSVQDSTFQEMLAPLTAAPVLALDVETTGLDPCKDKLVCLTLATPQVAAIFHPDHIQALTPLLQNRSRRYLIQHAPFDLGFLYAHSGIRIYAAQVYDTRAAARKLQTQSDNHPPFAISLKDQAAMYLGQVLDKGPATTFRAHEPLTLDQCRYTLQDARILFPLAMQHLLRYHQIQQESVWALNEMYQYIDGDIPTMPERE